MESFHTSGGARVCMQLDVVTETVDFFADAIIHLFVFLLVSFVSYCVRIIVSFSTQFLLCDCTGLSKIEHLFVQCFSIILVICICVRTRW